MGQHCRQQSHSTIRNTVHLSATYAWFKIMTRKNPSLTRFFFFNDLKWDRFPAGGRIDGDLFKVGPSEAVQYAPDVLVNLEALQQGRFAIEKETTFSNNVV